MKKLIALLASGLAVICCGGASEVGGGGIADAGLDGTVSADGGATGDGATTGDSGPRGVPGAVVADGGSGASGDAGAPGGNTSTLSCGSATCLIPSESCCLTSSGATFDFSCVVGSVCPAAADGGGSGQGNMGNTASLKCTAAANCGAGTVCCVSAPNGDATSECKPSCAPSDAQLCDAAATTTGCSAAEPCSSKNIGDWGLPPTFGTCGGKGN